MICPVQAADSTQTVCASGAIQSDSGMTRLHACSRYSGYHGLTVHLCWQWSAQPSLQTAHRLCVLLGPYSQTLAWLDSNSMHVHVMMGTTVSLYTCASNDLPSQGCRQHIDCVGGAINSVAWAEPASSSSWAWDTAFTSVTFIQNFDTIVTPNESSVCCTSGPQLCVPDTANDVQWNVSCTRPYSGSEPSAAGICPRTTKCKHKESCAQPMLSSVAPMLGWCAPRSTYACALTDLQCQGRFYLSCDISATPRQGVNSGSMCTHAVPLLVLAVCQVVWFLVDMRKNISDFVEMYHHPLQLCKLFWQDADSTYVVIYLPHQDRG